MKIKNLFLVIIVAAGCSKRGEQPPEHRPLPEGDFYKLAKEIYSEDRWLESCDFANRDKIYELVQELDEKVKLITNMSRSGGVLKSGFTRFELGPGFFFKETEQEIGKDEWKFSDVMGWSTILSQYLKVKGQAVTEENLGSWSWILRKVQFILSDDEKRIVYGVNLALDHRAPINVPKLKQIVGSCSNDLLCSYNELELRVRNAGLWEWVESIPYYKYFFNQIKEKGKPAMQRFFSKRLTWDEKRFGYRPYDLVHKTSEGALVIPLSTSDFGSVKKNLEEFFIEPWVRAGVNLSILWREPIDMPSVFKILYGSSSGGRSYVSYQDRHMKLYAGALLPTFAHEFGHVLGLRDEYYTIWNESTCSYGVDENRGNIMSVHYSGIVTPELVNTVRSLYGL